MGSHGIYHLFVYGSLRSGFQSPAYEYISRYFTLVNEARVKGVLADLGEYPAGKPTDTNATIAGELYRIKNEHEFSWAIGQLDAYEGISVEPGEEQLYVRAIADVYCNGEIIQAWIYWYNGNLDGKPLISSGDLLEYLQQKK